MNVKPARIFVQFAEKPLANTSIILIAVAWTIIGSIESARSVTAGRQYIKVRYVRNVVVLALRQTERNGHHCGDGTKESAALSVMVEDARPATKKAIFY